MQLLGFVGFCKRGRDPLQGTGTETDVHATNRRQDMLWISSIKPHSRGGRRKDCEQEVPRGM